METKDIKQLLEEFYAGTTTSEQEKYLHDFFQQKNIPVELETEKNIFLKIYEGLSKSQSDQDIPEGFNNRIEGLIENLANNEKRAKRATILRWTIGAAASIALLVGIAGYWNNNPKTLIGNASTQQDERVWEAYMEAQDMILYVAQEMNAGSEPINEVNSQINEIKGINKLINNKIQTR